MSYWWHWCIAILKDEDSSDEEGRRRDHEKKKSKDKEKKPLRHKKGKSSKGEHKKSRDERKRKHRSKYSSDDGSSDSEISEDRRKKRKHKSRHISDDSSDSEASDERRKKRKHKSRHVSDDSSDSETSDDRKKKRLLKEAKKLIKSMCPSHLIVQVTSCVPALISVFILCMFQVYMRYLEYDKWYASWKLVANPNGEITGVMRIRFMVVGLHETLNLLLYLSAGKLIVKFPSLSLCRAQVKNKHRSYGACTCWFKGLTLHWILRNCIWIGLHFTV